MNVQDTLGDSLLNRHDLDYEDYCNVNQGYLGYVLSSEISEKLYKNIIQIKPVFAVLNKMTLTLFDNENVKNLFKSFTMKFVKPNNIPLKWEGTHCW